MRRITGSILLFPFLLLACQDQPKPTAPAATAAAPQPPTPAEPIPTPPPAQPGAPAAAASSGAKAPGATPQPLPAASVQATAAASPSAALPASAAASPTAPAPSAAAVPVAAPPQAPAATTMPTPMPTLAANGHAPLGADKCRMCHRLQHDSWSATAHAKKGLDCEACHGNGADYKAMSVMKNLAAAKAAGLVVPTLEFCRKCHGAKADAAMLRRAHAHKGA